MFDYGFIYKVRMFFYLPSDDASNVVETNVEIHSTYRLNTLNRDWHRSLNPNGIGGEAHTLITNLSNSEGEPYSQVRVSVKHVGGYAKGDPIISEAVKTLQFVLGLGRSRNVSYTAPSTYKLAIVLPDHDDMAILVEKGTTYYKLMNQRIKKKNLLTAISRYLFRSATERDGVKLLTFLMGTLDLPENISYVLENRIPYHFFDLNTRTKVNCRLNAKLIGVDEVAIEVSDGIWGSLPIQELDTMVNTFYYGHKRSVKWRNCSPRTLWTRCIGEPPSDSQLDLMKEFLLQNRTKDLIENRAKELMNSLVDKYPDRINIIEHEYPRRDGIGTRKIMFVSGKMCDWAIIEQGGSATQMVKVYVWKEDDAKWSGGICIDNIHSTSSLGDQFAARALALLNDNVTVKLVHTIKRHIEEDVLNGERESRYPIPIPEIDNMTELWRERF